MLLTHLEWFHQHAELEEAESNLISGTIHTRISLQSGSCPLCCKFSKDLIHPYACDRHQRIKILVEVQISEEYKFLQKRDVNIHIPRKQEALLKYV